MSALEDEAVAVVSLARFTTNWLTEAGRVDPLFLDAVGQIGHRRRLDHYLFRNAEGHLLLNDFGQEIALARFIGPRAGLERREACVLLNGDGLETAPQHRAQTQLRNRVHAQFGIRRTLIIPHMALDAAEIDYDSILLIHVSGDRQEVMHQPVTIPPFTSVAVLAREGSDFFSRFVPTVSRDRNPMSVYEGTWNRRRWRAVQVNSGWPDYRGTDGLTWTTLFQPPTGDTDERWWAINGTGKGAHLSYQVHRLGASVFSAIGPDSERHRYLSAFDSDEPQPLYFLAQLPDEGKLDNYRDAINLLAPPVVHQARAAGRLVVRQGDIFAIETDLTDEEILGNGVVSNAQRSQILDVRGGGATVRFKTGIHLRKRRELMIYGTSHTATRVVMRDNGAVFVRGTMYHDPQLEDRTRTREHVNRALGTGKEWFLCVRNTVPRAR